MSRCYFFFRRCCSDSLVKSIIFSPYFFIRPLFSSLSRFVRIFSFLNERGELGNSHVIACDTDRRGRESETLLSLCVRAAHVTINEWNEGGKVCDK